MNEKKLELVDFLRGGAIFTIALMHLVAGSLTGTLNKMAAFGGAGVHVFILVSGFGLYLSFLKRPLSYRDFLKRRFSKVYWPYAIAVVGWVLWYWALGDGILWKEGISHLLLYKMFVPDLDVSLCYPYWFISCILQFYLCWPLIVRTARMGGGKLNRYGIATCMLISLTWTTAVGLLGYQDFRPWGSCFLQYLWEFVLGMWLAEKYFECSDNEKWFQIENIQWKWILIGAICGMCLSGFMGLKGGILKLYNDIPSLIGYLSCLLIVYKLGIKQINKFFVWASSFGYELYLVHSLTFVVLHTIIGGKLPLLMELLFCFVGAYVVAYCYNWLLKYTFHRK